MNRIFKYFPKRENAENQENDSAISPMDTPETSSCNCGFCGKSLVGNLFTGWTMASLKPAAAICLECIDRYATQTQFTRSFSIWYKDPNKADYAPLRQKLLRRIAGEGGSNALKLTVVDVAIRLLQRQSALLAKIIEERCPKTGVKLTGLPRIAIISEDATYCAALLPIILKEIGLIYRHVSKADLESGMGFKQLMAKEANGELGWAEYAIMYSYKYAKPNTKSIVVYAGEKASDFPSDVEKVYVDERVKENHE